MDSFPCKYSWNYMNKTNWSSYDLEKWILNGRDKEIGNKIVHFEGTVSEYENDYIPMHRHSINFIFMKIPTYVTYMFQLANLQILTAMNYIFGQKIYMMKMII
ncbi:hypothetical protein BMW23_0630 [Bodo saltans virus]|uniref:Uncharacterized protein n=1 Tax=Bodo saltans virus TaxID=2024608 RepID=A0A2H4UUZ5_9VIRU|nr:hypothetical protein QJ851_gp0613 [Bodo saltans virus]ATZ80676.1 hypothetical protein BMW23_0630 [Bodo saltans virus]